MKEIKITPPDGYEIDKDNSTFEKIVFKEIKKELPKKYEDLGKIKGYYSNIDGVGYWYASINKDVFYSKEQAQASIALAQLSQLREVYRQGWKPNWEDTINYKYIIRMIKNKYEIDNYCHVRYFLSFPNYIIAKEFLNNFRDLIEQASPLLFD